MRGSPNATLVLGVLAIALFLGVLEWFLLIQPRLSAAAVAREATTAQYATNAELQIRLDALKVEAERLPEVRAEVWAIRDQIPAELDSDGVRDLVYRMAIDNGVVLKSDSIGVPVEIAPTVLFTEAFAPYGLEPYVDTLTFERLHAVAFSVTIEGSYTSAFAFLDDVQTGEHRYILIRSVAVTPLTADAAEGEASVQAGSLELVLTGYIFALDFANPDITERPAAEPLPGEVPLPSENVHAPSNDRNFFDPKS